MNKYYFCIITQFMDSNLYESYRINNIVIMKIL